MPRFDLALLVGFFLGGTFALLGAIGVFAWGEELLDFATNGQRWTRAAGELISADVESTRGYRGGLVYRPVFEVRLEEERVVRGFDLTNTWSSGGAWLQEALARYPVGSRVEVMLSPRDKSRMALERGSFGNAVLLFVPPLFLGLGLLGLMLSGFRWMWLKAGQPTRGLWRFAPSSRLLDWSMDRGLWFSVGVFVLIFVSVIGGLAYFAWKQGNFILGVFAVVMVYGFIQAMLPFLKNQLRSRREQRRRGK